MLPPPHPTQVDCGNSPYISPKTESIQSQTQNLEHIFMHTCIPPRNRLDYNQPVAKCPKRAAGDRVTPPSLGVVVYPPPNILPLFLHRETTAFKDNSIPTLFHPILQMKKSMLGPSVFPHAVQVLCPPRFYEGFLTMGLRI